MGFIESVLVNTTMSTKTLLLTKNEKMYLKMTFASATFVLFSRFKLRNGDLE